LHNKTKFKPRTILTLLSTLFILSINQQSLAFDHTQNGHFGTFAITETFSNIVPIQQIVDDEWVEAPNKDAEDAFSQNELGIKARWGDISLTVSKRLDYFVHSNFDTAEGYYLDQSDQPLTPNKQYDAKLHLYHQEASGIRLGYHFAIDNLQAEVKVGYWQVPEIRSSKLTGTLNSDDEGNISGVANLEEYYSHKNFLKRKNNERWETEGYGITLDVNFTWYFNEKITLRGELKDLYNEFILKNSGYSIGDFNTDGTFINSLGGKGYLPIYQGKEIEQNHHLTLPARIHLTSAYAYKSMNLLVKYKRQADINFYYAGIENESGSLKFLLDIENLTPEFHYQSNWVSLILGLDSIKSEEAKQLTFGLTINYPF